MSNLLYLSHAKVRDSTTIPLEDLVRDFRELARQFPLPPPKNPGDDWTQTIDKAKAIVAGLPITPELYHHGSKRTCPCASCCGSAYRLLQADIEQHLRLKTSRRAKSA